MAGRGVAAAQNAGARTVGTVAGQGARRPRRAGSCQLFALAPARLPPADLPPRAALCGVLVTGVGFILACMGRMLTPWCLRLHSARSGCASPAGGAPRRSRRVLVKGGPSRYVPVCWPYCCKLTCLIADGWRRRLEHPTSHLPTSPRATLMPGHLRIHMPNFSATPAPSYPCPLFSLYPRIWGSPCVRPAALPCAPCAATSCARPAVSPHARPFLLLPSAWLAAFMPVCCRARARLRICAHHCIPAFSHLPDHPHRARLPSPWCSPSRLRACLRLDPATLCSCLARPPKLSPVMHSLCGAYLALGAC